jgi:polyisoprenyl-phosphate glycosyltransferase
MESNSETLHNRSIRGRRLSVILPTFNERENVREIYLQILSHIKPFDIEYEIIFVDDNSPDLTIDSIKSLRDQDPNVKFLLMSRRFGDQISLMAGLDHAEGDFIVIMDSDLQHPPGYLPAMIREWSNGSDIVIMQRETEGHQSIFKKWTEILFYKMMAKLSKTPIYYRFSGFALLDRKVVRALRCFEERDPFLRGLIGLVGYSIKEMTYREDERKQGQSKYRLFNLITLAISGITAFSDTPLYLSLYLGLSAVAISFLYALYVLFYAFFSSNSVAGWASTILVVIFFGGVQLLSTGILGIFLSKVFLEAKRRPKYIVSEAAGFNSNKP